MSNPYQSQSKHPQQGWSQHTKLGNTKVDKTTPDRLCEQIAERGMSNAKVSSQTSAGKKLADTKLLKKTKTKNTNHKNNIQQNPKKKKKRRKEKQRKQTNQLCELQDPRIGLVGTTGAPSEQKPVERLQILWKLPFATLKCLKRASHCPVIPMLLVLAQSVPVSFEQLEEHVHVVHRARAVQNGDTRLGTGLGVCVIRICIRIRIRICVCIGIRICIRICICVCVGVGFLIQPTPRSLGADEKHCCCDEGCGGGSSAKKFEVGHWSGWMDG